MEKYFETTMFEDATHIKVSVSYRKGGWNPYTHKDEKRGIYVVICPVKRIPMDGYTIEQAAAYSGCKECVKEMKRNSKKSVETVCSILDEEIDLLVSMFEDGRVDLVSQHLRTTDWTPRREYYVVCFDRVWKDHMVCICKDLYEAERVEDKWSSHSEKTRVGIVKGKPEYPATWYKVTEEGSIVLAR